MMERNNNRTRPNLSLARENDSLSLYVSNAPEERLARLNETVAMIADDLGAFDHALWLHGPLPSDGDALSKQLDQVNAFMKTSKDLESVIKKLIDEDRELNGSSSSNARRPIAALASKLKNLIEATKQRGDRLQTAVGELFNLKTIIEQAARHLTETETQIDQLGDEETGTAKIELLCQQLDLHYATMENVQAAGQALIGNVKVTSAREADGFRKQIASLDEQWQRVLQKACKSHKALKTHAKTKNYWHSTDDDDDGGSDGDLDDVFKGILEQLAALDGALLAKQTVKPTFKEANEQSARFAVFLSDDVEPGLEAAKRVVEVIDFSTMAHDRMGEISQRIANIEKNAASRRAELDAAVSKVCEFETLRDAFSDWLHGKEQTKHNDSDEPIITETLSVQLTEIDKLTQRSLDVKDKAADLTNLLEAGTALEVHLAKQDAVSLRKQLGDYHLRWKRLKDESSLQLAQMSAINKEASAFYNQQSDLLEWVGRMSAKLTAQSEVPVNWESRGVVQMMLHRLGHLAGHIRAKQQIFNDFLAKGASLLEKSPELDRLEVKAKVDAVKGAWLILQGSIDDYRRRLESVLITMGEFSETPETLVKWLSRTKLLLDIDSPTRGDVSTVNKLLREHQSLEELVSQRSEVIEHFRTLSSCASMTGSSSSVFSLEDHLVDGYISELGDLKKQVDDSVGKRAEALLESKKLAEQFDGLVIDLNNWFDRVKLSCSTLYRPSSQSGSSSASKSQLQRQLTSIEGLVGETDDRRFRYNEALTLGKQILEQCHPDAVLPIRRQLMLLQGRWSEVITNSLFVQQRWLEENLKKLDSDDISFSGFSKWLTETLPKPFPLDTKEVVKLENEPLEELLKEQCQLEKELAERMEVFQQLSQGNRKQVEEKWNQVVAAINDRHQILHKVTERRRMEENLKRFDFDSWRRRYVEWLTSKKFRLIDAFRMLDTNRDSRLTRVELIDGIVRSTFPTSRAEMQLVANFMFKDAKTINLGDFSRSLQSSTASCKKNVDLIEVDQYLTECRCKPRFAIERLPDGRYKFGRKTCVVRLISNNWVVLTGGSWQPLEEFILRNDPCRAARYVPPARPQKPTSTAIRVVIYRQ